MSLSKSEQAEQPDKHLIRCLDDKFYDLMTKTTANDNASSIKEQIATEKMMETVYEDFVERFLLDPE